MVVHLITNLLSTSLVIVSTLIFLIIYKLIIQHWNFFNKIGIKYVRGLPILGIHYKMILGKMSLHDTTLDLYKQHSDEQVIGAYDFGGSPMYVIKDVEILKKITTKDFEHFINHRVYADKRVDPLLGRNVFLTRDQDWRDLRSATSPAFTGSKMRQMISLINECSVYLIEKINGDMNNNDKMFDIKDLFERYVANTIASTAFGINVNSFEDENSEFYKRGLSVINLDRIQGIKFVAMQTIPKFLKFFKIPLLYRTDIEYFRNMIRENMKYREKNNINRSDMIHMMMQLRKGTLQHDTNNDDIGFATVHESEYGRGSTKNLKFVEDDLVAQCMSFIFGGFATIPAAECFLAHELAVNVDIQDKLYDEIRTANEQLSGKPLTYEILQTMKYMDMVISESLRRWPIVPFTDRRVNKPYTIELKNGKTIDLKVGQVVWIPITGYHMDEKYFPNPEKFDPERFNDQNKETIVPGSYLPFSCGPRNCVGSRFALMQIKSLMYTLLLNFKFEMCEKTTHPIKLKLNSLPVDADFWLKLVPRD